MSNEKLGTEPVFGYPAHTDINNEPEYGRLSNTHNEEKGMSKRLWIATQIAAAIYSNPYPDLVTMEDKLVVKMAYNAADELLKQENE